MSRPPWTIAVLSLLIPLDPLVGQAVDSTARPQVLLRLGVAAVTANGIGVIRPALDAAVGVLLQRRYAIVGQYLHHETYLAPGRAELGVFARRFLLGSLEWSRHPLYLEGLGDVGGSIRGTIGAVFREGLGTGAVVGAGLAGRVSLTRQLSVVLDVEALLSVLPNDSMGRCPAEGSLTADCNPYASSGHLRPEGKAGLLLELRL